MQAVSDTHSGTVRTGNRRLHHLGASCAQTMA